MSMNGKIVLNSTMFLAVFSIPFLKNFDFWGVRITTTEILFSLAFLIWFFNILRTKNKIEPTPLALPIAVFLGTCALSILSASNKFLALKETIQFIWLFGIYFLIFHFAKDKKNRDRILFLSLLAGGIISLFGVYQYYHSHFHLRASGTFGYPNDFGGYLIGLIPLAIGLYLSSSSKGRRFIILVSLLLMSLSLFATLSRGSWIGLIFGGIIMMFVYPSNQFSVKSLLGPILIILIIFLISGGVILSSKKNKRELFYHPGSDYTRILLAKSALTMAIDHPFLGIGLGNYPVLLYGEYASNELKETNLKSVHNMFLQIATETGIIGLASFFWLLYRYYKSLLKLFRATTNRKEYGMRIGFTGGVSSMLAKGMFEWLFAPGMQEILILLMAMSMIDWKKDEICKDKSYDEN